MEDKALPAAVGGSEGAKGALSLEYNHGLSVAGLANDQLNELGEFINAVYEKVRTQKNRQVTRNGMTFLRGAMFALGTRERGNEEWKEHCSSSLREIFHEWLGNGFDFCGEFREFYPKSPKSQNTDAYKNLKLGYQYFSGIAHHNASGIMAAISALEKRSDLKLEDCYRDDKYIERVRAFFSDLGTVRGFAAGS